jgi:hypothetical protein
MGRFKVAWLTEITGRGTAVAGEILDGTIRVGDRIVAPASLPGVPLPISGVVFADNVTTRESWVALVVPLPPAGPAPASLKDTLGAGTVLEIESSAREAGADPDPPHNVR